MTADSFLDEDTQKAPSAEGFLDAPHSADDFLNSPDAASPEVVASEAQRASTGAVQALDVMSAPRALDWSDVNEKLDTERFYESESLRAQAALDPQQAPALLAKSRETRQGISPYTTTGQQLNRQELSDQQARVETATTAERTGRTPSDLLSSFMGPGLSPTVMPVVEGAARNVGPALGGAIGAAKFIPHPGANILAQLAIPVVGALMGSQAGSYAQEMVLQKTETPEETVARQQRAAEDFERNPGLSRIGAAAAGLPYFGPGLAQFGRAAGGDVGAMMNLGIAGALGGGLEVLGAMRRGETASAEEIAAGIFTNLIMNEPTKLGRRLGLHPSSEQKAIEDAQAKYGDMPPKTPVRGFDSEVDLATRPVTEDVNAPTPDVFSGVPNLGVMRRANELLSQQEAAPVRETAEIPINPEEAAAPVTEAPIPAESAPVGEPVIETPAPPETPPIEPTPEPAAPAEPPPVEPPPPRTAPAAEPIPAPKGSTSNKEPVVNPERAERALDPVIKEATLENANAIDYAERAIEANPERPQQIIDRLRTNPMERSISVEDGAILLIERTKIRNRRNAALERMGENNPNEFDRGIAELEFAQAEAQLNRMDQAAQDARSTWGRFGQLWQRSMREDFSLDVLEKRARNSKGDSLTPTEISKLTDLSKKAQEAQDAVVSRTKEVQVENAQKAIDDKIAEVKAKNAPEAIDPAVKSLADRIIARLETAASNSAKELRALLLEQRKNLNVNPIPNPKIVYHLAKMAAARTAKKAIEFGQWSAEMIKEWGADIEPYLKPGWDQREEHIDTAIDAGAGVKKKAVKKAITPKAPLSDQAQQARVEEAIANRIKEGKPISSLAPYVNKLQESFIKQGIEGRDPLIDAVHGVLKQHDPAITRDDTMEVMSKYGSEYASPLSKDPAKMTRRQVDGEIQEILKLRDISNKVPIPKSGPERPTPGPTWRALIKQVNAAKKKLGVVVTDPETQLKSTQDSIRTRLRNDIEDMTLELETGEKRPEQTPTEYTQDMEILKSVRDRVRETLKSIEENPQMTDAQRLALAKRSAEGSLAMWERRLAGEQAKQKNPKITSPEIEAIKAKRDEVKAHVEEIDAADAVLQENMKAEALVRQIENVENQLANNLAKLSSVKEGPDSQLVTEARDQLNLLKTQLSEKRAPEVQRAQIEAAELKVEKAIQDLTAQLEAGEIASRRSPTEARSQRLEDLRLQRDALLRLREDLRKEARPKADPEDLKLDAIRRSIAQAEATLAGTRKSVSPQHTADTQVIAEAREQLAGLREQLAAKNAADPVRQMKAVEKAEAALEASIKKLDGQIQAGDISTKTRRTAVQSERLEYLRAQRDAMTKLRNQLRNEAKPRLSADQLAIKNFTSRALTRAAELRRRMADGDFGPRTRKDPIDVSGDKKALDAKADLMNVESDFLKMQEKWKLDQMNWVQRRWRNLGQGWDAASNIFLSFDLSTPLQTAFAMAAHPIEGAKAIGKGVKAFGDQFFKGSESYAKREAARIANDRVLTPDLVKAMKLELPSALGKKREENMSNVLEKLADLDARRAGLPNIIQGLLGLKGKQLVKGGAQLAKFAPMVAGRGIKASNAAFETIANSMRAQMAKSMLKRWYGRGGPGPTKQQLELIGELVNVATGKGGLQAGNGLRRVLFAPNYYLSIIKQLSGYQFARAGYHLDAQIAKDTAREYVRAMSTIGTIYGLNLLFGNDVELNPLAKGFLKTQTSRGTQVDLSMGRGAWLTALAQIANGSRIDKRGREVEQDRKETALNFVGGRLNRGVTTALTTAWMKDYKGKDITIGDIAKDFVIPLSWRDFDDVIQREGYTRGSFLQLLNVLGVNYRVED